MSLPIPSGLSTTQPFIPLVDPDHAAKLTAAVISFTTIAKFRTAVAAEQASVAGGNPALWQAGQIMRVSDEPATVYRQWNGQHARTAFIGTRRVLLAADSSVVSKMEGTPTGGTDGDWNVDEGIGNVSSRAGGVWTSASTGAVARLSPITVRAGLPKLVGSPNGLAGDLTYRVRARCNRIVFVYTLAGNPGETMKSMDSQYANGFGDIALTCHFEGGVIRGVPQAAYQSPLAARYVRNPMGDCVEMSIDLPRYVNPGEEIRFKNFILQTSHSDPRQYGYAGTMLGYANYNKSKEQMFYQTGTIDRAAWEAWCDDPTKTTTLSNATHGDYGWHPHNLCAVTYEESVLAIGDSKTHGQDVNGRYGEDSWPKIDSLTGSNGEASSIFRDAVGMMNGGILTEKGGQITDVSNFACRRKLAEYCSWIFFFEPGVNDFSADAALQSESTVLARYASILQTILGFLITPKTGRIGCATVSPNPGTNDGYLTLTGQSPASFIQAQARLNGAIRQLLVGNNAFVDPAAAVTEGYDTGIIKVTPNARRISAGNFVIHYDDSTGVMTLTAPTATWQPRDSDYPLAIFGARFDNGDILAACKYVSPTVLRLLVRNSEDDQRRLYNYDFLGAFDGSNNLTINAATNNIGMGAWWLTTDTLHYTKPGEQLMYDYNRAKGLSRL